MLFFNLENGYESFKELFGEREIIDECGKVKKIRKNKIVLNVLKDTFQNKHTREWETMFFLKTMPQLLSQNDIIERFKCVACWGHYFQLMGKYTFSSNIYEIDNNGLCFDGDTNAIRYRRMEDGKIFKMKAAKFYSAIFTENGLKEIYGEKCMIYCSEKFAEAWNAFASERIDDGEYTLHVGKELEDFEKIYSVDGMSSCMAHSDQYSFYKNAVEAKAAWLTNKNDEIVCRCVIFTDVVQISTGKHLRYAERQYAIEQSDKLKNILIAKLYAGNHIDIHKRVGASCHDNTDICDKWGSLLPEDCELSIKCYLEYGDILSYQDTFVYYDMDCYRADNYGDGNEELNTTDTLFGGEQNYDEWADEYTNEDTYVVFAWNSRNCELQILNTSESNRENSFTYIDNGRYHHEYVENDYAVWINGESWYIYDEEVVEIDGEFYVMGEGCQYCEDIDDYATDYIKYNGYYYANYQYSELLDRDLPEDDFDRIEADYAENNGYVWDGDANEWVEKTEEACVA